MPEACLLIERATYFCLVAHVPPVVVAVSSYHSGLTSHKSLCEAHLMSHVSPTVSQSLRSPVPGHIVAPGAVGLTLFHLMTASPLFNLV